MELFELKSWNKVSMIACLLAGSSLSCNVYSQPCNFTGFSVGGGLGIIAMQSSINSTFSENGLIAKGDGQPHAFGAKGNIFAGYAVTPNDWLYLGGEVGLNLVSREYVDLNANATLHTSVTGKSTVIIDATGITNLNGEMTTKTTVRRRFFEPTLDFKPGILLTPNLLVYARAGMGYNNITTTTRSTYGITGNQSVNIPFTFTRSTVASASQEIQSTNTRNVLSWRTGIGFLGMMSHNLGLSADYIYTFYDKGSVNRSGQGNTVACDMLEGCVNTNSPYVASTDARPSDQEVLLQLVYYLQ